MMKVTRLLGTHGTVLHLTQAYNMGKSKKTREIKFQVKKNRMCRVR